MVTCSRVSCTTNYLVSTFVSQLRRKANKEQEKKLKNSNNYGADSRTVQNNTSTKTKALDNKPKSHAGSASLALRQSKSSNGSKPSTKAASSETPSASLRADAPAFVSSTDVVPRPDTPTLFSLRPNAAAFTPKYGAHWQ
jgi:hypothetical protein